MTNAIYTRALSELSTIFGALSNLESGTGARVRASALA